MSDSDHLIRALAPPTGVVRGGDGSIPIRRHGLVALAAAACAMMVSAPAEARAASCATAC